VTATGEVPDILEPMTDAGAIRQDLHRAALFGGLGDDDLARLAGIARPVTLEPEQTVFAQGDPAAAFYLLAEGRVKVFKLLRDGRSATLRHVEAGETFGESVLFHDVYPSSSETMDACRLYRFDTAAFRNLLLERPQLALGVLGAMARLLVLLNRRVEELLLPVPARLARYLLELADEQLDAPVGARPQAGTGAGASPPALLEVPRVVKLPTSKRELSARIGTVPETLSRTFDRLKRAKVIRMSGGGELIEILDFAALRRLAQE
jgi:CRP/FNR family transcriptional regulator, dissimilatory nitrate respiration regulator